MEKDVCGCIGIWSIFLDVSLDYVVISYYHWNFLQVRFCDVADNCSTGVDWYFDLIKDLQSASIPSKMALQRLCISVASIHDNMNANVQERYKYISQEASPFYLRYEVGNILEIF